MKNQRVISIHFVPKQKKGLSTVITSLIIILLVLVAIGIIYVVYINIVEKGTQTMNIGVKCLEVDIRATEVTNTAGTNYDVALTRKAGGDDVGGVKLVFYSDLENSEILDLPGNIEPLGTITRSIDSGIENANKVDITVYFLDESGEQHLCTQTNSFSF